MSQRKGIIIQMTGMSGAGKSTLAAGVKSSLEEAGYKVAIVDGDVYRQTLCSDLGFSKADRLENIKRLGRFAYAMAPDFDVVLVAAINPFEEGRTSLREMYNSPLLYVKCELEQLIERDPKGLYRKAMLPEGHPKHITNFTGISDPFEQPMTPKWTIDTCENGVDEAVGQVTAWLKAFIDKQLLDFLEKLKEQAFLPGDKKDNSAAYRHKAKLFRGLFELNMQELYQYIFGKYTDEVQFEAWLKDRMGELAFDRAKGEFLRINRIDSSGMATKQPYAYQTLTAEQLDFWQKEGYLVMPQLVDTQDCDRLLAEICAQLGVRLEDSRTWCPSNPNWQGILLFSNKTETEEHIRLNPQIRAVFEDLYRDKELLSMRAPLGYMPPVSTGYPFRGSPLHWDIDMEVGPRYHIQAMVYLHDVGEEEGAFSLVPGMHHEFGRLLQSHGDINQAAEVLRTQELSRPIAGKKGDLILWIETMPHAATPNRGYKPRFVQYITYEQLRLT